MKYSKIIILALVISAFLGACQEQKEHTAAAVRDRDSVSMMISYGVNTLISDSGVIKYRIVTERWEVNTVRNPSRWIFEKGLFFEQFTRSFMFSRTSSATQLTITTRNVCGNYAAV